MKLPSIEELIESDGQITIGHLHPVCCVAVANDEHNTLAMLKRRPNESFGNLPKRLDQAIARAVEGLNVERRFERYCDGIVSTLLHADREQPARWYMKGLMLPGERKSVEPMAGGVQPEQVRSAHQSMHHLVADAPWSDEAMLSAVTERVLPKLMEAAGAVHWIVDDTRFPKKGKHSVGVARQYCGQSGKQAG